MSHIMLAMMAVIGLSVSGLAVQTWRVENMKKVSGVVQRELNQCGANLVNLIEDVRSDREVDAIPDSALIHVPDHWLLAD